MKRVLIIKILLLFGVFVMSQEQITTLEADSLALVEIYNATDGQHWKHRDGWLLEPVQSWFGVYVGPGGRVEVLELQNNRLEGELPASIGQLDQLFMLNLRQNDLYGQLPEEIGGLVNLIELRLDDNQFAGKIPGTIKNLESIVNFNIQTNQFTGPLPMELSTQMSSLSTLSIKYNNFSSESCPVIQALLNSGNVGDAFHSPQNDGFEFMQDCFWSLITDSLILVKLYYDTDGANWNNNTNWLSGSLNNWYGVTVSGNRVTEISLSDNGLTGTIPPDLGDLTDLGRLDLSNNQLSEIIPPELGFLNNLYFLYLSNNQLSGSIPNELGNLQNLIEMVLFENQLSGSIPSQLSMLPNIQMLYLSSNLLEGAIPDQFGLLNSLTSIYLGNNQLSGTIPAELGNLSNLVMLDLGSNAFSGTIPENLASATGLMYLYLNDNQFADPIPLDICTQLTSLIHLNVHNNNFSEASCQAVQCLINRGGWEQLMHSPQNDGFDFSEDCFGNLQSDSLALVALYNSTNGPGWTNGDNWLISPVESWYGITTFNNRVIGVNLYQNNLSGNIPAEIGDLNALDSLNLARNSITGIIPEQIGLLANLELLDLWGNQLDDPIPESFYDLTSLKYLNIRGNNFSGEVSSSFGNFQELEFLNLMSNNFSGVFPEILTTLGELKHIYLHGNSFLGELPLSIGNMIKLETLNIGANAFEGNIPDVIGDLINLKTLSIWGNGFTGNLPESIGNLSKLTDLYAMSNQLDEPIPESIGNLVNLEKLFLYSNQISGPIPQAIGDLATLKELRLYDNMISGPLPESIGNCSNLEDIVLSDNQLTGPLPESLGSLSNLIQLDLDNNQIDGNLPASLSQLDKLVQFKINSNQISGPLPEFPAVLPTLRFIWANDNQISGPIPENISNLINLEGLFLNDNQIDAALPAAFCTQLPNLVYLTLENNNLGAQACPVIQCLIDRGGWTTFTHSPQNDGFTYPDDCQLSLQTDSLALVALYNATNGPGWIDHENWLIGPLSTWTGISLLNDRVDEIILNDNNLQGPLPPEIGYLTEMQRLLLIGNELSGTLPNEIGQLTAVYELLLSSNNFSGNIPPELGNLSSLEMLSLDENVLSGVIPNEICNLQNLISLDLNTNELSGPVPQCLCDGMPSLSNLYLSYNNFGPESCELISCLINRGGWDYLSHSPQNTGFTYPDDCMQCEDAIADAGENSTLCEGTDMLLNGYAENYSALEWITSGDGLFDDPAALNPVYTPGPNDIQNGVVQICLTAFANEPCADSVDCLELSIQKLPVASAGPNATICQGENYIFDQAWAENYSAIQWVCVSCNGTFDDENSINPTYFPSPFIDYPQGCVYIGIIAEPISPCAVATDSIITLCFVAPPEVDLGENVELCGTETIYLNDIIIGEYQSYAWDIQGDGELFNDENFEVVSYTPGSDDIQNGFAQICLTAIANEPCEDVSDCIDITIAQPPQADAGPDASVCKGESYLLEDANVQNAGSVFWYTNNGTGYFDDQTIVNPTYYPTISDYNNGYVGLILTTEPVDPCEIPDQDAMKVYFFDPPFVNIGEDKYACVHDTIFLDEITIENYESYNWVDDGYGAVVHDNGFEGVYYIVEGDDNNTSVQICLQANGFASCASTQDCMIIEVQQLPYCDAGPDAAVGYPDGYTLSEAWATGYVLDLMDGIDWVCEIGDGTFDDDDLINPTYYPSFSDLQRGYVKLIMYAFAPPPCLFFKSDHVFLNYSIQFIINNSGWSGISGYVEPSNPNLDTLLGGYTNNFEVLYNFNGLFIPGQKTNTLGDWDVESGYIIKASEGFQLPLMGGVIDGGSLENKSGWSIIPVLSTNAVQVEELFSAKSTVVIVKEVAGPGVFWPEYNINTLEELQPGSAYYILYDEPETMQYPEGQETWNCGDMLFDLRDGQSYNTVQIGDHCWMAENLNYGTRIDISLNQTNNQISEKYCFNNDPANCDVYGGLYQWGELMQYATQEGVNGICPAGWHVATDDEWKNLEGTVDSDFGVGDPEWNKFNLLRGSNAGGNLKEAGFNHWLSPNAGAVNSFGFTAMPGSWVTSAVSGNLGESANFWTSSRNENDLFFTRYLGYLHQQIGRDQVPTGAWGLAARCVKGESVVNLPPTLPRNPDPENGALNFSGEYLSWFCSDPDCNALNYNVYLGETDDPPILGFYLLPKALLPELTGNTIYYWKVVAYDTQGNVTEGPLWSFRTPETYFECGNTLIDYRDGKSYSTIQIGSQCWMQENLNIGDRIEGDEEMSDDGSFEKYCYDNDPANCETYGGLYQWGEMMQYGLMIPVWKEAGEGDICPYGWHVPTYDDWDVLFWHLCDDSFPLPGGLLKEEGTTHWQYPNVGATNESGFTALPGGSLYNSNNFLSLNQRAHFWSSTSNENGYPQSALIRYDNSDLTYEGQDYPSTCAYSVRCVNNDTYNQPPEPPGSPSPGHGTNFVPVETSLSWVCNDPDGDPLSYDVYFGDAPDPPLYSSNLQEPLLELSSLDYYKTYYWKVIAHDDHNNSTTGPEWKFKTIFHFWECGDSFIDFRNAREYQTTKIGNQCWMAENLNIGNAIPGSNVQANNGVIEKYCYDDNSQYCDAYGGLYQWNEMMKYGTNNKGICPEGWELPSDEDWKILEGTVDSEYGVGDPEWSGTGFRGLDAGGNLKDNGSIHWQSPNTGATDDYNFTALPGGLRNSDGIFEMHTQFGSFWSSTFSGTSTAWGRGLSYLLAGVNRQSGPKDYGLSVRCIKMNLMPNQPPNPPHNPSPESGSIIMPDNVILFWSCNDPDGDMLTYDLYFGTNQNPPLIAEGFSDNNWAFNQLVTGVSYFWKIVAHDDHDHTTPGSLWTFTTDNLTWDCGETFTDERDNKTYETVQIGEQCWMAENMNIGDFKVIETPMTDNGILEKYCYENNPVNCDTYGGLYQWDEMMQYTQQAGAQGICPDGWHLPTDLEWKILEGTVDTQFDVGDPEWNKVNIGRGLNAGGNLKESGTSHWNSPNTGATNSSEFTALPSGYGAYAGGFAMWENLGLAFDTWTSSRNEIEHFYYRAIGYQSAKIERTTAAASGFGLSVRCIHGNAPANQPPSIPSNPSPQNGAQQVPEDIYLSWSCNDPDSYLLNYDLYLGTEPNPPIYATGLNDANWYFTAPNLNDTYYWKVVAHDEQGNMTPGPEWSFSPDNLVWDCGEPIIDSRDQQLYNTVLIGNQCWMRDNLKYGEMIDAPLLQTDNETAEKYCWANIEDSCDVWGGLYEWGEMMDYSTDPEPQGLCPWGWHVPSRDDFCEMLTELDPSVVCNETGWTGTNVGGKLKNTNPRYWNSPNTGATNSSGFNAIPANGYSDGTFLPLGNYCIFWSSAEYEYWTLSKNEARIWHGDEGFPVSRWSVRCVKDE